MYGKKSFSALQGDSHHDDDERGHYHIPDAREMRLLHFHHLLLPAVDNGLQGVKFGLVPIGGVDEDPICTTEGFLAL